MKFLGVTALTLAIATLPVAAAVRLELSPGVTNQINITSDSTRGWAPAAEQRLRVLKTVEAFLDALEGGRYAEAYGMQTEINRRNQTLAQFAEDAQKFKVLAGPVRFWRALKVTWTKD